MSCNYCLIVMYGQNTHMHTHTVCIHSPVFIPLCSHPLKVRTHETRSHVLLQIILTPSAPPVLHYAVFSSQLCLHLYLLESITSSPLIRLHIHLPKSPSSPPSPPGEGRLAYFKRCDYHGTYQEGWALSLHMCVCVSSHACIMFGHVFKFTS